MEIIKDAIGYIAKEWTVIGSAPVSIITAVALTGIAIWFFVRFVQKGEIAGLTATIATQDQRIELLKERIGDIQERFENIQEQFSEQQIELDATKAAIAVDDRVAMQQHSLAASTIASNIHTDLDSTAAVFKLPAHLAAASGEIGPVPFEGMEDAEAAKKDDNNK